MKKIVGIILMIVGIILPIYIFISGVVQIVNGITPFVAQDVAIGVIKICFCGVGAIPLLIGEHLYIIGCFEREDE